LVFDGADQAHRDGRWSFCGAHLSDESLGSILSDDEAPTEEVTEQSETTTGASNAGETPAAKLDAVESETDEIDAAEPDDLGDLRYSGLKKAAKKERKFRQAAEKQAKELQRQYDQLMGQVRMLEHQRQQPQPQQQTSPQAQDKKPDEWDELLTKGPAYVQEVIRREFAQREQQAEAVRQQEISRAALASRARLLQEHEDGAQTLLEFKQMMDRDPDLKRVERLALASEDPAGYLYQYTKEVKRIQQHGSIDELLAAERAKWEAEHAGTSSAPVVAQARPQHKTIAGARGSSASVRRPGADPDSLAEILS
jgi:hypothetical protein